jgi:hypothetical protein
MTTEIHAKNYEKSENRETHLVEDVSFKIPSSGNANSTAQEECMKECLCSLELFIVPD